MQTESIFRAARTLETVEATLRRVVRRDEVQMSFRGIAGELCVTLTGKQMGEFEDVGTDTLFGVVSHVNAFADDPATSLDDRFTLEFMAGNVWRVEAA